MQILSGMWITIISFLALLSSAESQLAAPTNLIVSNQGIDGFTITFDPVTNASGYQLTAVARYDSSDTVTINGSTSIMVAGRRSNKIYDVSAQGFDADDVLGAVATISTRTAPNGIGIRSVITAPTFITIFLEPVPGVTAHEVEVKSSSSIMVISPTDFGLSHVAIATGLNPNTNYSIRARAAKAGGKTFNAPQSPFGSSYHAVTDMASVFASVVLEEHTFNSNLRTNSTFISNVERDLLNSIQANSSVFSISVVKKVSNSSEYDCENGTGGKTRCFYEILVKDQTLPPNLPVLSDEAKYSESVIRYNASGAGYYDYFVQANKASLSFSPHGLCAGPNIATDYRLWSLYNGTDFVQDIPLDTFTNDGQAQTELRVTFNSSGVIFNPGNTNQFKMLNGNVIYGFKQNYLIKVCRDGSSTSAIHDRRYDSYNPFNNGSDAFTILITPAPLAMSSDLFSFSFYPDNTGATITFQPIMERAESYNITYNGVLYSLTVEDLDSSSHYKISITSTAAAENITVSITGTVRQAKNALITIPTTAITDTNDCLTKKQSCDSNATCSNTIGSDSCVCNTGYTGDGTSCADVNECTSNTHNCDGNANCTNTAGSFDCNCNTGSTGNGTSCMDIDECASNTHDCDGNATCTNNAGSFDCNCNPGYTGNGTSCTDVNECTHNTHKCVAKANCTNNPGSFDCNCNTGYTGNETSCTDVNECTSNTHNCDGNATCTNNAGSFDCNCNTGYTGNRTSCTDVNECTSNTHNCDGNATCTNNAGSFDCNCNTGYTGNGTWCTVLNPCASNAHNCDRNATCTNNAGSFNCSCNPGFTGNGTLCFDLPELFLKGSSDSYLTVDWNVVFGGEVYLITLTDGTTEVDAQNTSSPPVSFLNLYPGREYIANLVTSFTGGLVVNSSSLSAYTKPRSVKRIIFTSVRNSSVKILWEVALGSSGYVVRASLNVTRTKRQTTSEPLVDHVNGSTRAAISNLQSGTAYKISVMSTGLGGNAEPAVSVIITAPDIPSEFKITHYNGTSVNSSWTAPTGATSYKITLVPKINPVGNKTYNSSDLWFSLDTLNNTLAYDLLLVACNAQGYCGDDANEALIQTVTPYCTFQPCDSAASCTNGNISLTCECNDGFDGDGFVCSPNFCKLNLHNCSSNASCVITSSGFTCICPDGSHSAACPPPCDNRADDLVCFNENLGELCAPSLVCRIGNSNNSRVKYDCTCVVNRNNTCGGTQSITVSCDVDYCKHTDACSSHTDSVCFEDGNFESGGGYECRCQAGYFYSSDENCQRPGVASFLFLAFVPLLFVLILGIAVAISCKCR